MIKIFVIILTALLAVCSGKSGTPHPEPDFSQPAKLVFAKELHDFGTLHSGEIVAFTFAFSNAGPGWLLIKNADSGCACLEIEYPETPVAPGETGQIQVIFNSSGERGFQYKPITIFANTEKTEHHLAIAAQVINQHFN